MKHLCKDITFSNAKKCSPGFWFLVYSEDKIRPTCFAHVLIIITAGLKEREETCLNHDGQAVQAVG